MARYGVAPSGALDERALRIGNLLTGNPENTAGLETFLMGLKIRFRTAAVAAVTGADLQPQLNGSAMPMWQAHGIQAGDELTFGASVSGCRAYLAVGGGISVPRILGSRSTHIASGFGGFKGRSLKAGDVLLVRAPDLYGAMEGAGMPAADMPVQARPGLLRVLMGPQDEHFSREGKNTFLQTLFTVSAQSSRVGIRLEGASIARRLTAPESIVSEGIVAGAVQVPGDGRPIILLKETVSGGYSKIATVISADLARLGQLLPGDRVQFTAVTAGQAGQMLWEEEARIHRLRQHLIER
jgi:biotin-dependent carboxylase-like uncharacterized protein